MDDKEIKLEEISNKVNNYKAAKSPPIFEMFVTLFSILTAVMLFLFPDMLQPADNSITNLYWLLLSIMPQYMWAMAFFISGVTKAIGMLVDNNATRITGLVLSALLYTTFSICYILNFPTIGAITFTSMTIFTLISISTVKHTGLKE
ncbi:cation transport ATPase [Virgibacillus halotolerans]|uniref:hypothetical protein n=1 Tax=Virgibacillus halotolerans TaxID=1071053 RepID=UPI001960807E|nr:hypothetical protein [Virgibacillus halotolerans]MBM7598067.1 cation transport ATPase [Virgibacillus halotolerans]